ncbi:unnamed protein product [Staurois parvus]|uniref:Uncharacterized protein n=1 Tax=Staurois parvus TaxID=386267 RepID=A0ABN9CIS8_9NEOB|nr:unnamed protein product [Staurois parvus]
MRRFFIGKKNRPICPLIAAKIGRSAKSADFFPTLPKNKNGQNTEKRPTKSPTNDPKIGRFYFRPTNR